MGIKKDYDDLTPNGQVARLKKDSKIVRFITENLHNEITTNQASNNQVIIHLKRLRTHKSLKNESIEWEKRIIIEIINQHMNFYDSELLGIIDWIKATSDIDTSFLDKSAKVDELKDRVCYSMYKVDKLYRDKHGMEDKSDYDLYPSVMD